MLARVRATVPGVAVSSDFIVGFCGEDEASFRADGGAGRAVSVQEQLHLQVQRARGDQGGLALSRRRPEDGQEAAKQRITRLANGDQPRRQSAKDRPNRRGAGGRAEQEDARRDGWEGVDQLTGRTSCDRIVVFEGPERLLGQVVRVVVEDASAVTLFGRVETVSG